MEYWSNRPSTRDKIRSWQQISALDEEIQMSLHLKGIALSRYSFTYLVMGHEYIQPHLGSRLDEEKLLSLHLN